MSRLHNLVYKATGNNHLDKKISEIGNTLYGKPGYQWVSNRSCQGEDLEQTLMMMEEDAKAIRPLINYVHKEVTDGGTASTFIYHTYTFLINSRRDGERKKLLNVLSKSYSHPEGPSYVSYALHRWKGWNQDVPKEGIELLNKYSKTKPKEVGLLVGLGREQIDQASYFKLAKFLLETDYKVRSKEELEELNVDFSAGRKIKKLLEDETEYLLAQKPNELISIVGIISNVDESGQEKLMNLGSHQITKLCTAHDIAWKNIKPGTKDRYGSGGKNYLPDFLEGLNKTLDEDYENLDKWCDTIIDGLQEVARTGQSLDEVMSRGN
ncbi:hypothetical protein HOK51_03120 [Candidatus Woesearchaeota archaeon]|jgi:hypothetical protein|nr:hypothetical protein [Candidatus Woesearchaeota archaeon]MBT6518810.1 hypothetical protein [Candidatus Woesearchaeota archaeon]MBT7367949.1 hypothetical protein [Candidatus Woesearchaeota archaeon]